MFQKYLNEVFEKYKTGEAGERSYYPLLENLLKEFKNSQIIIEAKNSAVGIPDFKVGTPKNLLVGYIEAKDVGQDLDRLSKGEQEQIKRYVEEYPKLILTSFTEFRLFENHDLVDSVVVTQPITLKLGIPALQKEEKLLGILERFFSTTIPEVHSARRLSELLAHKTHVLKGLVQEQINLEDKTVTSVEELLEAFRKTLSPQMTEGEFSDMYAQTITFGLFTARLHSGKNEFNRKTASEFIPHTIPLLRKIFWLISGQDIPQYIEWQVDEIAEILANTRIDKIQNEFFSEGKGRDPIIHFYETFLSIYDPKEREKRGVYYTPLPVVSYITRSINRILKDNFKKSDGFADSSVLVLDPAAGTLTFPAQAIFIAKEEFTKKYGEGSWPKHVKDHILKDFYAFELLMAPYAVGHLKISLLLKEMDYEMQKDDRFKLYLTNTLEMEKMKELEFFGAKEIAEESGKAYEIKHKIPILVVMGNPPYSVSSSNIIKEGSEFFEFYESYKEKVRKEERNIQPLSDDYIKFIAFAHWKIKKAGKGIIGMITNNSYLDGLIHRDIRRILMEDFDEIYILNLHGSSKRQEKTPEGGKDENVFDIQQGVSVILLIKDGSNKKKVSYADLWGLREEKYKYLEEKDVERTKWQELTPKEPQNFFVSKDFSGERNYSAFHSIAGIFVTHQIGLMTGQDDFFVDSNRHSLAQRIQSIFKKDISDVELKTIYNLDSQAGKKLLKNREEVEYDESLFIKYNYRPFDQGYIYAENKFLWRSVEELKKNFLEDNLALVTTRILAATPFRHVFISEYLGDNTFISNNTKERNYFFPLYIYDGEKEQDDLFLPADSSGRKVNFKQSFLDFIDRNLISQDPAKRKISYEEILYYIYAVLYSNIYREKYQEFLKIDFPRIPFTKDYELFKKLSELGEELVNLHLLKSKVLDKPSVKFQGKDSNLVEKREYSDKRIYVNDSQYFEGVEENVWNYFIGGYQVLDKWLKDRKGGILSSDDIKHYCKVASALSETIKLQKQIDSLYPDVERSLVKEKI